jgi:hypothetical protein
MPLLEAGARIRNGSGSLSCKPTHDWRMRECTGKTRSSNPAASFEVLVASVHDSAAVIVLSTWGTNRAASGWVSALTKSFGRPNHKKQPGGQSTWQWIRASKMLRVVERKTGGVWEASVTLTHGPLLDGLGPTQREKP